MECKPIFRYVYHYTSEQNSGAIIRDATILFTNRRDLESDEIPLQRRLEQLKKIWGANSQLAKLFDELIQADTYIACFSEEYNNEYLWKRYACNGVCIELDFTHIDELRKETVLTAYRLQYLAPSEWLEKIQPVAVMLAEEVDKVEDLSVAISEDKLQSNDLLRELLMQVYISLLETKDKESAQTEEQYIHEKELRLAIIPDYFHQYEASGIVITNDKKRFALQLRCETFTKLLTAKKTVHLINYVDQTS